MKTDDPEFRKTIDMILGELTDADRQIRNIQRLATNERVKEYAFFARTQTERAMKKLQQFGSPDAKP